MSEELLLLVENKRCDRCYGSGEMKVRKHKQALTYQQAIDLIIQHNPVAEIISKDKGNWAYYSTVTLSYGSDGRRFYCAFNIPEEIAVKNNLSIYLESKNILDYLYDLSETNRINTTILIEKKEL